MSIIMYILKLFLLPATIFRSLMILISMAWSIILVTCIVLVGLYWDEIKKMSNNVIDGIDTIKNTVNNINTKIKDIETKIELL